MVILKQRREIEIMKEAGRRLAEIMGVLKEKVEPGMKTKELDALMRKELRIRKTDEAFSSEGFPAAVCVSVNDEIVHGIPDEYTLKEGDILSMDIGLRYKGYCADMAATVGIGDVTPEAEKLIQVTRESLEAGINKMYPGNRMGDLGFAIQKKVEENGYHVVRDFVGHGIGKGLQEDPQVPNYGSPGRGIRFEPGMVLAVEPMVNAGTEKVKIKKNGWTAATADGSLSCHFEHTVAITESGPMVLTRV